MGKEKEVFVLNETAAGYLLVRIKEWDVIMADSTHVLTAMDKKSTFLNVVEFVGFCPFRNASEAKENVEAISNGEATETLVNFLELHIPKKKKVRLGVLDPALGKSLADLDFDAFTNKQIIEIARGCNLHLTKIVKTLEKDELHKMQASLGQAYSRTKVQFDPKRYDKPIQQAISLIESLDKTINLFAMRVKEWYGWHFPELQKIVVDNRTYCELALEIRIKEEFNDNRSEDVERIVHDAGVTQDIMSAKNASMGQEITEADMNNIARFATNIVKMANQKLHLNQYLNERLGDVAPNLQAIVGDVLGGKLICHAGGLTTLAKYPASTIQILGAEKALFFALKNRTNTPKYGFIFQSGFISRAPSNIKGKISRILANKCALATRIDAFSSNLPNSVVGQNLAGQIEDRLVALTAGKIPTMKNSEVMEAALDQLQKFLKEKRREAKASKKSAKNSTRMLKA